jgi:hypothetical protein
MASARAAGIQITERRGHWLNTVIAHLHSIVMSITTLAYQAENLMSARPRMRRREPTELEIIKETHGVIY